MKYFYIFLFSLLVLGLVAVDAEAQNYTGATTTFPGCGTNGCHNVAGRDQFTTWQGTAHSVAYDSVTFIQTNPDCLPCHTTGWDEMIANGGFDDYFPPVTPDDSAGIARMKNVQCEACHGPVEFSMNHPPEDSPLSASLCGTCHTDEHHPTFEDWGLSAHAVSKNTRLPGFEFIASNRQCAACHTAEGFLQFVNDTSLVPDVDPPGQDGHDLTCAGCHNPHDGTYTAQLRLPVTEICVKCHNPEFDPSGPPPVEETPHHTTAYMFEGVGAYEFPGYTYSNSPHTTVVTEKCVTCHVWMRDFADPIPAYTGHTFIPVGEACTTCHADYDSLAYGFDYRGVQTEVTGLLADLEALLEAATPADSLTDLFMQARFNRDFVEGDGSHGIHNTEYTRTILEASIAELGTLVDVKQVPDLVPKEFALAQNYPNPFNPATEIRFSVAKSEFVQLDVFDILGRHVVSLIGDQMEPGEYRAVWDGKDTHGQGVISGVYFYTFRSESFTMTRKMVLLK
jgi:predicted CXXCH cytochrome family protein